MHSGFPQRGSTVKRVFINCVWQLFTVALRRPLHTRSWGHTPPQLLLHKTCFGGYAVAPEEGASAARRGVMSRGRAQGDLAKREVMQGSHRLLIRSASLGSCLLMDGPPAAGPPLCSLGTEIHESRRDMPLPGAPAEREAWTSRWLVAVCPRPPSVRGAERESPNRGRYSTKQISPLLTPGDTPEVKGPWGPLTASLFFPGREKVCGLLLPPTAWLPRGWALLVGVGPPVGLDNNAEPL